MDTTERDRIGRLEWQIEELTKSFGYLRDSIMADNGPANAKFIAHEKLVNTRLTAIEVMLGKLTDRLEQSSRFPWAPVFGFTGLLLTVGMGIGGFFLNGVNSNIARLDRDIATIQNQIVPRAEHVDRWRLLERRGDENSRRIEGIENRLGPPR